MKTQETTQEMRDNIQVLTYKIPTDNDIKKGSKVCYKDINGIFCKVGEIDDIYVSDGITQYSINTSMGAYLAGELRLIKD